MRRAGVEPAQPEGGRVTAAEARQCPADATFPGKPGRVNARSAPGADATRLAINSVARVGVEPTNDRQGLSLAALPVCVPCRPASLAGFEPAVSTVTGWRGLQAPLQGLLLSPSPRTAFRGLLPVGARGIEPRYSCSQGTRITGFLDAVEFGEKGSNLHFPGQNRTAYR